MDAKDTTDKTAAEKDASTRADEERRERLEEALDAANDEGANPDAVREASRLGTIDAYLVKTDLEELDGREDIENDDGSISSLANAEKPER